MRIINWNVNGIRSIIKKDFVSSIQAMAPDILCLQETKATVEEVKSALELLPGYFKYANASKARKGYSGTALLSRTEPLMVTYDMGMEAHDQEGRVITAEYQGVYVVTVYVPNSGENLVRLPYRETWDRDFREYLVGLQKKKPVVVCGDLNVAHQPIDIARPKENYNKSSGYTQQEIDGFQRLLDAGFVDTFRRLHPDEVRYTYWNYMFNARSRNIGWRIDYFLVSEALMPHVKEALIFDEHMGSDHCPVGITME